MHSPELSSTKYYVINGKYRCRRTTTAVVVHNQCGVLVAEYNEPTRTFTWLRILPPAEKAAVEKWVIGSFDAELN